jgi:hypothetical protein
MYVIEFKRGKDKRKRKRRSSALKTGLKVAGGLGLAAGGVAALRYTDPILDGYQKSVANKLSKPQTREVVRRNVKRAFKSDVRKFKGFFGARD